MKLCKHTRLWLFLLTALAVGACTSEDSTKDSTSGTDPESSDDDDDTKDPSDTKTGEGTKKTSKPSDKKEDEKEDEKDTDPVATDVEGSAECEAYCDKKKECGSSCYPDDCAIKKGQCEASTRDYLDCLTTTGDWQCGSDGFGIVHGCKYDASLCD